MEPLISVIVPIYNVEKYLNKCIESIVNQTYKNLEIILVDDGSPDNCPQICDQWKEKDNRIKVIHKENGGLSDARNVGLDITQGEYIAFVDSDDYIHVKMYETLITVLLEKDCDIVQCDFSKVADGQQVNNELLEYKVKEYNVKEALYSLINENPLKQVVWNKLYKKYIFDTLRFEVGKLNEDDFFTYQAFDKCKKICSINVSLYYYLVRDTSIMGEKFTIRRLDGLEARINRYNFLKEKYIDLASYDKKILWFYIMYIYQKVLLMDKDRNKTLAKNKIKTIFKCIRNDNVRLNLTLKETVWIILSNISLEIVCKIRNKLKINVK